MLESKDIPKVSTKLAHALAIFLFEHFLSSVAADKRLFASVLIFEVDRSRRTSLYISDQCALVMLRVLKS
jgi:hypothetical protein